MSQNPLHHRAQYTNGTLSAERLEGRRPHEVLAEWIVAAARGDAPEPNAFALSTVDADGTPSCRVVLLRGLGRDGLRFYSNRRSRKGRALEHEPRAAATFWWGQLERQVRIEGTTRQLSDEVSDEYFASRPRASQLSAWASPQSEEIEDRSRLAAELERIERRFPSDQPVPRPPFWGGYLLVPDRFEFWQGRADRRHDRLQMAAAGTGWRVSRLAP